MLNKKSSFRQVKFSTFISNFNGLIRHLHNASHQILVVFFSVMLFYSASSKETATQIIKEYETLIDSSEFYLKIKPDLSLTFAMKALEISRKLQDEEKLTESYLQIGIIYRLNGNLSRSEFHLKKALSFGKKYDSYPKILKEMGITLKQQSKYDEALSHYLKALDIYQNKKQYSKIASINNNIGRLYFAMGDDLKALDYYRKSIAFNQKDRTDPSGVALHNIGAIMEKMNQMDSAKLYYEKALRHYKNSNDRILIAYGYASLGNILKNEDSALLYLMKSYELRKELNLETDILESLFYLGKLKWKQKKTSESETLFAEVYDLAVKKNNHQYAYESANHLAEIYRSQNDFAQAYFYKKNASSWKDSLYQREKKVKELGFDYRLKQLQQEEELEKLTTLNQNQELQIKTSRLQLEKEQQLKVFWLITIIFILSLLVILLLFSFRQKNKNRDLQAQKLIIEQKSKENEILIREVHHRVKNNLHSVMSLLRLEKRKLKDPSADKLVENMENRIMNISFIHEILYNQQNLTSVALKKYFEIIGLKIIGLYPEKKIAFEVTGNMNVDSDTALYLGQLFSELFTNSCKHAFQNTLSPEISIVISKENNTRCMISYSDNGSGILQDPKTDSFGKKLIESHGRKLEAEISEYSREGFHCEIKFNPK